MQQLLRISGMALLIVILVLTGLSFAPVQAQEAPALAPEAVTIDLQGLASHFTWSIVDATPYDASQPPGPTGAPRHLVMTFDGEMPQPAGVSQRILYIYPIQAYQQLWDANGNPTITNTVNALNELLANQTTAPQTSMPHLPPPPGTNDVSTQIAYLSGDGFSGVRYVGRFAQSPNPVTSDSLDYFFPGHQRRWPVVRLLSLAGGDRPHPGGCEQRPQETWDQFNSDMMGHINGASEMLNGLALSDWAPDLASLDAMITSLTINPAGSGAAQLQNTLWQWQEFQGMDDTTITVPNPANYTVHFDDGGQVSVQADCNMATGIYTTEGSSLNITLYTSTMAMCAEDSLSDQFQAYLNQVVSYVFDEGGNLHMSLPMDGGILKFSSAGAPTVPEPTPVPPPPPPPDGSQPTPVPPPDSGSGQIIPPDLIQLNTMGLASYYSWQIIPEWPYNDCCPPGPVGMPAHILLTFDGESPETAQRKIYFFPVDAYEGMWNVNGNTRVTNEINYLKSLLAGAQPGETMPLLPPAPSYHYRWWYYATLWFQDGRGVRYIADSPNRQAIGPIANDTIAYYYQGLTNDGEFYVSMVWPVSTSSLPNTGSEAPQEVLDKINSDYNAYLAETKAALGALPTSGYRPDISLLDNMIRSLSFKTQ